MLFKVPFPFNSKNYIQKLNDTGAVNSSSAVSLEQVGLKPSAILKRYIKLGIIVSTNQKYYLDRSKLKNYSNRTRRALFYWPY